METRLSYSSYLPKETESVSKSTWAQILGRRVFWPVLRPPHHTSCLGNITANIIIICFIKHKHGKAWRNSLSEVYYSFFLKRTLTKQPAPCCCMSHPDSSDLWNDLLTWLLQFHALHYVGIIPQPSNCCTQVSASSRQGRHTGRIFNYHGNERNDNNRAYLLNQSDSLIVQKHFCLIRLFTILSLKLIWRYWHPMPCEHAFKT